MVLGLNQEAAIWMIVPADLETVISCDAVHEEHAQLEKLWSSLSRRGKFCSIISQENKRLSESKMLSHLIIYVVFLLCIIEI